MVWVRLANSEIKASPRECMLIGFWGPLVTSAVDREKSRNLGFILLT